MNKKQLKNKIQESFLNLAPDVYERLQNTPLPPQPDMIASKSIDKYAKERMQKIFVLAGALAACFLLFLCSNFNSKKDIYVYLDVNPSICLVLNPSYEIKSIKGINVDGEYLAEKIALQKGASLEKGITLIIDELYEEQFLSDDSAILVTIQNGEKEDYAKLKNTIEHQVSQDMKNKNVGNIILAFRQETEACNEGGRKQLEKQLIEKCGMEEKVCQNMTILELIQTCNDQETGIFETEIVTVQDDYEDSTKKKKESDTNLPKNETGTRENQNDKQEDNPAEKITTEDTGNLQNNDSSDNKSDSSDKYKDNNENGSNNKNNDNNGNGSNNKNNDNNGNGSNNKNNDNNGNGSNNKNNDNNGNGANNKNNDNNGNGSDNKDNGNNKKKDKEQPENNKNKDKTNDKNKTNPSQKQENINNKKK